MSDKSVFLPQDEPGSAAAEDGLVILDGPDGLAVTMTPDAAAKTGQSLIDAAAVAAEQARRPETPEHPPASARQNRIDPD